MGQKRIHFCLNVRGALSRRYRDFLEGMFAHPDGRPTTADESREILFDELKKGHEVIPVGQCDNFDYSGGGCLGHDVPPEEASS